MNYEKCGKFIQELRKNKGLTQQDLAKELNYTDKTISRWETGKAFPEDNNTLEKLSKLFEVSIEELTYGERITKKNRNKYIKEVYNDYINNKRKNKKIRNILIYIITILLIILTFIFIYFNFIKNTIKIYKFTGYSNNFNVITSTLTLTNDKIIFNFDKFNSNNYNVKTIKLYYIENNNNKIIYEGQNESKLLIENLGYHEYNFDKLKDLDLYIEIYYDDNTETLKFEKELLYSNNKIFNEKINNIKINTEEKDTNNLFPKDYITFLENYGFVYNDGIYEFDFNDLIITIDTSSILISINNDKVQGNIISQYDYPEITFNGFLNNEEFSSIYDNSNEKNCINTKCALINDYVEYVNYFKNKYNYYKNL